MESFNSLNGNRVKYNNSVVKITACDFNINKKIIAIGLKDGGVKIIGMETLSVKNVFIHDGEMEEEFPAVTAVNCKIKDRVIVGYEDGKVREFVLTDPSQFTAFVPDTEVPVACLTCATKNSFILAAYCLNKGNNKIYGYKSGGIAVNCVIGHSVGTVIAMEVLERIQVLVTLSDTNNELSIYDYINGEQLISLKVNIPTITDKTLITSFTMLAITKEILHSHTGDTETISLDQPETKAKGDIIAFGLANGTILTAYLSIKLDKGQLSASILPQKIYKAQESGDLSLVSGIKCLHIDSVTDHILAGNGKGGIIAFSRAMMQIFNPKKAEDLQAKDKSGGWLSKTVLGGWGLGNKSKSGPPKEDDPMELQLEDMSESNK